MILRFLEAQKHAFPYAKAKVGGPYETLADAIAAQPALVARYPDCEVRMVSQNIAMKKAALLLGSPKIEERTNA